MKRNYAVVLVNKPLNDGANEAKAVEETKSSHRNITGNRVRRKKNKAKREENKDGLPGKDALEKKYVLNFWSRSRVKEANSINP